MSQACDRCHARKVRCDRAYPCRRCTQSGVDCAYTDRSKERLFRPDQVEALEAKIRRLEERNKLLLRDLARVRTGSAAPGPTPSERSSSGSAPVNVSSGTIAPRNDVISEVSYLTIDAAGERHYLGSASGVLLAKFVRANVDVDEGDGTSPHELHPHRNGDNGHFVSSAQDVAAAVRARELPSALLAKKIVLAYLNHDHLCYPIFSPRYVLTILRDIYVDPHYYASHKFEAFVLDMILAIATTHIHKHDLQVLPSAESHHIRAMASLSDVLQLSGIRSLQAILLVAQYRMGSSVHGNSASMWHLVGIATRIALQLGLHRESAYPVSWSPDWETSRDRENLIEQETARRCFWSTIAMDRIVSNVLGRPLAIRRGDIDTTLPTPASDVIMSYGLEGLSGSESVDLDDRTSIFVHITKYRMLCGKILVTMHGSSFAGPDPAKVHLQRETIARELDEWRVKMEGIGLVNDPSAVSCFRSRTWFEMIYHNAVLMLYRPSPRLDITGDTVALRHIFASAKQSIQMYAALHRSRRLNHSWITLQAVFMSGLSYIFAVGSHFRERRRTFRSSRSGALLEQDPSTIEIVNDTRACSNVLVAVSESWNSLRNYTDVFNRLSDAVLADVIKFEAAAREGHDPASAFPATQPPLETPISLENQTGVSNDISTAWNRPYQDPPVLENPSPSSVLAVDMAFQNSFDDLQFLYNQEQVDYSVYQLSQAWFDNFDGLNR